MRSDDTRQIYEQAFNGQLASGHFEVIEAMHLCMLGHRDQWRRKNQVVYALHPFRILTFAETVMKVTASHLRAAILLHDVFEDTKITPDDARKAGISEDAILIALELTRPNVQTDSVQERRRIRLEQLLDKAEKMSNGARMVKALDRMDNLADAFCSFSPKKLWYYTQDAIKLHAALKKGIRPDSLKPQAEEALGYLQRTLDAVVEACKKRGDKSP